MQDRRKGQKNEEQMFCEWLKKEKKSSIIAKEQYKYIRVAFS